MQSRNKTQEDALHFTLLPSGKEHKDACLELQEGIEALIEKTVAERPNMTSVSILGVLRLVEHNFLGRIT